MFQKLTALLFVFFTTTVIHAQIDLSNYIKSEELSAQVKFIKGSIKHGDVDVYILKDDPQRSDVVFGTWLKMVIKSVEEKNVFDGFEFHLTRTYIYNVASKDTIFRFDWTTDNGEEELINASGDADVSLAYKFTTGSPMVPGTYRWQVEMADICSEKKTSVYLDINLIQNPSIEIEEHGALKAPITYLYDENDKFIYTVDSVYSGKVSHNFDKIEGFHTEDGIAKIGMEYSFVEVNGDTLVYNDDALEGSKAFIDKKDIGNPSHTMNLRKDALGKSYIWTLKIWDKYEPENYVISRAKIIVK